MATPYVNANDNGFNVYGHKMRLTFYLATGKNGVGVSVTHRLRDKDRDASLTYDNTPSYFKHEEVQIVDNVLQCFSAGDNNYFDTSYFSAGFRVVLEPGMSDLINKWLPVLKIVEANRAKGFKLYESLYGHTLQDYEWHARLLNELITCAVLKGTEMLDRLLELAAGKSDSYEEARTKLLSQEFRRFYEEASQSNPDKIPHLTHDQLADLCE